MKKRMSNMIWRRETFSFLLLEWMSIIPSLVLRLLGLCGMHWKSFMTEPTILNNQKLNPLCNNMSFFAWRMVNPSPCKWDSLILSTNCKTLVRTFQTKIALIKFWDVWQGNGSPKLPLSRNHEISMFLAWSHSLAS